MLCVLLLPLITSAASILAHACDVVAGYARDHEPCVIFIDEIDAIGGKRASEGQSTDREIQRTLMEVRGCSIRAVSLSCRQCYGDSAAVP